MTRTEVKYLLESMTSCVDRSTARLWNQSMHSDNLWNEMGDKQNHIVNQRYEIKRLKEKWDEFWERKHKDKLEEAEWE